MASFRLTCSSTAWWFFRVKPYASSVNLFSLSVLSHKGRIFLNMQVTAPSPTCSGKVNPGDFRIQGNSPSQLTNPKSMGSQTPRLLLSQPAKAKQQWFPGPRPKQEWGQTHSPNIPTQRRAVPLQALHRQKWHSYKHEQYKWPEAVQA